MTGGRLVVGGCRAMTPVPATGGVRLSRPSRPAVSHSPVRLAFTHGRRSGGCLLIRASHVIQGPEGAAYSALVVAGVRGAG